MMYKSMMNGLHNFNLVAVFIFLIACQSPAKKETGPVENLIAVGHQVKQDTTFLFYLDSVQILNFLKHHSLNINQTKNFESFYIKRNNAFAWINNTGINEYAHNFINLLNHEEIKYSTDTVFYQQELGELFDKLSDEDYKFVINDSLVSTLEILLTINFFDYAKRNWSGINDEDLKKASWFIERKKLNYDNLLDTILKSNSNNISSFEPVYRQYGILKKYLKKYDEIEKAGGWETWPESIKEIKRGDTSSFVPFIKKQLYILGDLTANDSSNLFDERLVAAVNNFQKRNGLKQDGIITGKTLLAMKVPVHDCIEKILINMERCKWVPVEQKGDYLAVNIPDFKLLVYHNDTLQWSCNVIVGKTKLTNNTVIFNDNLEYIVFSPYWNIPKSILIKETIPAVKRNPNYLTYHNMEIVNGAGKPISPSAINWNNYHNSFPYTIRQKPGENNSLGLVKFLFPNSYDIYMHDTPQKSLFGETTRAFSHGCIRLEEPTKLAVYLLREDSSWTEEKIYAAMHEYKQVFVKLKNKVPVFIAYFTAWVDRKGELNFRNDIYHHDEKMKKLLFAN